LRKQVVKARKGESMAALAKRYKVTVEQVAEWNNMGVNASLKAGQRVTLMLPGKAKRTKAAPPQRRQKAAR